MSNDTSKHIGATVTEASDKPIELPNWLSVPDPKPTRPSKEELALTFTVYDQIFPRVMEMVCEGYTLTNALKEFPYDISRGRFRQWANKDPDRKMMMEEAEKLLADCLFDDFVDLNRNLGENLEDIEVIRLKTANLKWLLQVYNKKRFGESKQIELNTTVSARAAMDAANARAATVIDITDARVVED